MRFKDRSLILAVAPAMVTISLCARIGRGALPEPFDITNHIANTLPSGAIAAYATASQFEFMDGEGPGDRLKAFAIGTAIMTLANVAVESRIGTKIFNILPLGHDNTADMLDAAYGVPYGIFVSWLTARAYPGAQNTSH